MHFLRPASLLALSIAAGTALAALVGGTLRAEENVWPFWVGQTDDAGQLTSWQAAGPLIYRRPAAEPGEVSGLRPLFAQWRNPDGTVREVNIAYPIFVYRTDGETYRWSIFQLINRGGDRAELRAKRPPAIRYDTFDVWPFWFSRQTGETQSSYGALFPIAGKIKSRFGYDQISFVLFPLYGQAEKRDWVTTATPWPFIKTTRGGEHGFAFWPLFGWREREGTFDHRFFLWPLGWYNVDQPGDDDPKGSEARRQAGFLPFFTRETGPGYVNAGYLWPFFGYTDRVGPPRYHETRYFWPFIVRGDGADRNVERWAPFYTHSINKGVDKTWIVWPLYRERHWVDGRVLQTQRQLFYFIYRTTEQRSLSNPHAAPAEKTHYWPFVSVWDNGAGRRQWQFPSPLEIFFPDNERIRASWSPLFSLYRYDQQAPGDVRQELLWGLATWSRKPDASEFHLGPLLSVRRRAGEKRIALGNGLVAWQRSAPGARWHWFWFDFPRQAHTLGASGR